MKKNDFIYFYFLPDGHYGYPEPVFNDDLEKCIYTYEQILNMYRNASYSYYSGMDDWDPEEGEGPPDLDNNGLFEQFGHWDLYGKIFIVPKEDEVKARDDVNQMGYRLEYIDYDAYNAPLPMVLQVLKSLKNAGINVKFLQYWSHSLNKNPKGTNEFKIDISVMSDSFTEKDLIDLYASGVIDDEDIIKAGLDLKKAKAMKTLRFYS